MARNLVKMEKYFKRERAHSENGGTMTFLFQHGEERANVANLNDLLNLRSKNVSKWEPTM